MSKDNRLQRFLGAQRDHYDSALKEVKNGRKQSHWMWYIFPQIQGLGYSEISRFYAIQDLDEARAFLNHPVLGVRLISISSELLKLQSDHATQIFGSPDDLKLKSCMTLFDALNIDPVFQLVLEKYFDGTRDEKTIRQIRQEE